VSAIPTPAAQLELKPPAIAEPSRTPPSEPERNAPGVLVDFARAAAGGRWVQAAQMCRSASLDAQNLERQLGRYSQLNLRFGTGAVEGAAGALYYEAPLTLEAPGTQLQGVIRLRRANNVDGASAEALAWRIEAIEWR
jgi:hypothetical protein